MEGDKLLVGGIWGGTNLWWGGGGDDFTHISTIYLLIKVSPWRLPVSIKHFVAFKIVCKYLA